MNDAHWAQWHRDYDDPSSALSQRLAVVQMRTRTAITAAPPGPVRLISVCAGQGRDVIGAVTGHPRATDVSGRLVEWNRQNADVARSGLAAAGLAGIEVVQGDASLTDAYDDVVPANVLLLCGIFGNVSDDDIKRTVQHAASLCAPAAVVIWTRHRRDPDLTPSIRQWFRESRFAELAFDAPKDQMFSVGTYQLVGEPLPFQRGLRLFTFE